MADQNLVSHRRGINYKPSSVLRRGEASIINLRRQSLAISIDLPPDIWTGGPSVYAIFQPTRCTAEDIATFAVGSYPAFSPLPSEEGGYFLLHYYTLTNIKPLTCVVPYVARTFLSHLRGSDRASMRRKGNKKERPNKFHPQINFHITPQPDLNITIVQVK